MVIISTSADEVIIQAVSPEFSGSLVAAYAPPAIARSEAAVATAPSPAFFSVSILMSVPLTKPVVMTALQRVTIRFAGADTHDLLKRRDEDLSVADLPGLRLGSDRIDHRFR